MHWDEYDDLALTVLVAALLLTAFLWLVGCATVEATPDTVVVHVLGQAEVATGCPAGSVDDGAVTTAGLDGVWAGSPCVTVRGGPISSTLGNVLSAVAGLLSGLFLGGL